MLEHSILGWLAVGAIAGVLGRLAMPERDPGGVVATILIGICGALLAGLVAGAAGWGVIGWPRDSAATLGAVALLGAYRLIVARRIV